ncbi:MAG: hypothetical protein ABFS10_05065, partial [Bacteroidota bacterium]
RTAVTGFADQRLATRQTDHYLNYQYFSSAADYSANRPDLLLFTAKLVKFLWPFNIREYSLI